MAKKQQPPKSAKLFAEAPHEAKPATAAYRISIDGGSRGNPGPASYGVVIRDPRGEPIATLKKYIGRNTNNVAEYYGLIAALDYAQSHKMRALRIESDSELLVKQMRGLYKVKSADLQPLFERARKMAAGFEGFRIEHVYREQNREADALANEALDEAEGRAANSTAAPKPAQPKPLALGTKPEPRRLKARYQSGILYPLEEVELPDGTVLEISLHLLPEA